VQRRLRPDEVARLVEQYKAGATARELGARFGIHRSTVAAHLERAGVPTRRGRGLHPDEINDVARLYAEGWSALRLSREYGVSDHTVTAALRKADVPIRPRGRRAQRGAGPVGRHRW
jgi:lambda repressor-like predicted transcriptional regulator